MSLSVFKTYKNYTLIKTKMSLMQLMEYRVNLISTTLGTYGYTFMSIIFIQVIFSKINELGGWSFWEMITLLGVGQIIYYFFHSFLSGIARFFIIQINTGELDKFLLKPLNTIYTVSTENFNFFILLPSVILGLIIFSTGLFNVSFSYYNFIYFLPSLLISSILFYLVYMLISLLTFWWSDTRDLYRTYSHLQDLQNYPSTIYGKYTKPVFTVLIPIGVTAYVPTYFLLKGFDLNLLILQLTAFSAFLFLCMFLWKRGIKNYSSASS